MNYFGGKMNIIADNLARQKPKTQIHFKIGYVLETNIFAHYISRDYEMRKGLAK